MHVDVNRFKPKHGTSGPKLKFMFVGRVSSEKNLDHFLRETKNDLDIEIEICGSIDSMEYFEYLKQISINWEYTGRIPHSEVHKKMQEADIVFITSLTEGCPREILEAMACGKPILYPAIPLLVEIGPHGFKHDFTDLQETIQRIKRCNRDFLTSLGIKNREKVVKEFDQSNEEKIIRLVENMGKMYNDLK